MSDEKNKKETKRVSRVALRPTTENILVEWHEAIKAAFPTFSPSSSDLVAWAVERIKVLSKKQIEEIRCRYFDEVKNIEVLLSQLKKAKASGDEETLRGLLLEITAKKPIAPRTKIKRAASPERNAARDAISQEIETS